MFNSKVVDFDPFVMERLRGAAVAWHYMESGAPAIHPATPLVDPKLHAIMEKTRQPYAARRIDMDRPTDILACFLALAEIGCGPRTFDNPLIGLGPYSRYDSGIPENYFETDSPHSALRATIRIDLTEEHVLLLRNMSEDDRAPEVAPAFDGKRPWWSFTHVPSGVRAVLTGDDDNGAAEIPDEDLERYRGLHRDMAAALQVFLCEAQIPYGTYARGPLGAWKKVRDISPRSLQLFERMKNEWADGEKRPEPVEEDR
jgi:hypothetical protein